MTMSDIEFLDYSLSNPSPLNDEDLSIGQFLEPLPNSFEPHWFTGTGAESVGSTSNNDSSLGRLNVLEPEPQRSTTLPSLDDSTVWVDDLIGSSGFFAPLASEVIPDVSKPFDGQIPVENIFSADVAPSVNIFAPEDDDFECVLVINCSVALEIYMNISL